VKIVNLMKGIRGLVNLDVIYDKENDDEMMLRKKLLKHSSQLFSA